MDRLGHLGWVANRSYEFDGLLFGVRTNSEAFAEWVDAMLSAHVVRDVQAEPNYSVVLANGGFGKRFHVVYRDASVIARTLDLRVVAHALFSNIESLRQPERSDAVYLPFTVMEKDGATALLHGPLVPWFLEHRRRVLSEGLVMPWGENSAVDLRTGALVPPPPTFPLTERALGRLDRIAPAPDAPEPWTSPEKWSSVDLFVRTGHSEGDSVWPISRAVAVYTLATMARNLTVVRGEGLEAIVKLVAAAQCYEVGTANTDLIATLGTMLDQARDSEDLRPAGMRGGTG
jgi:hypothetical protein